MARDPENGDKNEEVEDRVVALFERFAALEAGSGADGKFSPEVSRYMGAYSDRANGVVDEGRAPYWRRLNVAKNGLYAGLDVDVKIPNVSVLNAGYVAKGWQKAVNELNFRSSNVEDFKVLLENNIGTGASYLLREDSHFVVPFIDNDGRMLEYLLPNPFAVMGRRREGFDFAHYDLDLGGEGEVVAMELKSVAVVRDDYPDDGLISTHLEDCVPVQRGGLWLQFAPAKNPEPVLEVVEPLEEVEEEVEMSLPTLGELESLPLQEYWAAARAELKVGDGPAEFLRIFKSFLGDDVKVVEEVGADGQKMEVILLPYFEEGADELKALCLMNPISYEEWEKENDEWQEPYSSLRKVGLVTINRGVEVGETILTSDFKFVEQPEMQHGNGEPEDEVLTLEELDGEVVEPPPLPESPRVEKKRTGSMTLPPIKPQELRDESGIQAAVDMWNDINVKRGFSYTRLVGIFGFEDVILTEEPGVYLVADKDNSGGDEEFFYLFYDQVLLSEDSGDAKIDAFYEEVPDGLSIKLVRPPRLKRSKKSVAENGSGEVYLSGLEVVEYGVFQEVADDAVEDIETVMERVLEENSAAVELCKETFERIKDDFLRYGGSKQEYRDSPETLYRSIIDDLKADMSQIHGIELIEHLGNAAFELIIPFGDDGAGRMGVTFLSPVFEFNPLIGGYYQRKFGVDLAPGDVIMSCEPAIAMDCGLDVFERQGSVEVMDDFEHLQRIDTNVDTTEEVEVLKARMKKVYREAYLQAERVRLRFGMKKASKKFFESLAAEEGFELEASRYRPWLMDLKVGGMEFEVMNPFSNDVFTSKDQLDTFVDIKDFSGKKVNAFAQSDFGFENSEGVNKRGDFVEKLDFAKDWVRSEWEKALEDSDFVGFLERRAWDMPDIEKVFGVERVSQKNVGDFLYMLRPVLLADQKGDLTSAFKLYCLIVFNGLEPYVPRVGDEIDLRYEVEDKVDHTLDVREIKKDIKERVKGRKIAKVLYLGAKRFRKAKKFERGEKGVDCEELAIVEVESDEEDEA